MDFFHKNYRPDKIGGLDYLMLYMVEIQIKNTPTQLPFKHISTLSSFLINKEVYTVIRIDGLKNGLYLHFIL